MYITDYGQSKKKNLSFYKVAARADISDGSCCGSQTYTSIPSHCSYPTGAQTTGNFILLDICSDVKSGRLSHGHIDQKICQHAGPMTFW